ncbi:MAG: Cof-type HAD-IIB family hydrolase [Turicibacter sp.]
MTYKMIVLDLDGTLFSSQNQILSQTKDALLTFQKNGGVVVLASGRATHGMKKAAIELELDKYGGYLLSYNGGQIISFESMEVLFENTLTSEICHELHDMANEFEVGVTVYKDHLILTTKADEYITKDAEVTEMTLSCLEDFKGSVNFNPVKCMYVGHPKQISLAEVKMKEKIGDELSITLSMPHYLEFMAKDISKAYSLEKLLDHLGLCKSQLIACGDGYNDLEMIEFAGLGVAMENAVAEVKLKADYITASNDDNGIAKVIEKYIFNQ